MIGITLVNGAQLARAFSASSDRDMCASFMQGSRELAVLEVPRSQRAHLAVFAKLATLGLGFVPCVGE